jgi:hypothetical protein
VETHDGTFTLLGLCEDGGKRLVNPEGQIAITKISPNPAGDHVEIDIETIERGRTQLIVMDVLGRKIATLFDGEIASGEHRLQLTTANIAAGRYYVLLITPTLRTFARMDVTR